MTHLPRSHSKPQKSSTLRVAGIGISSGSQQSVDNASRARPNGGVKKGALMAIGRAKIDAKNGVHEEDDIGFVGRFDRTMEQRFAASVELFDIDTSLGEGGCDGGIFRFDGSSENGVKGRKKARRSKRENGKGG